jgi:hypothetical protein
MSDEKTYVWVFNGGGNFPSGVFSSREKAEAWIAANRLSGCLTMYPLDQGAYEWAIETGSFKVRRDDQKTPKFIGKFASGYVHYHYENGDAPQSGGDGSLEEAKAS